MTALIVGAFVLFLFATSRTDSSTQIGGSVLTRTGYINGQPYSLTVASIGGGKFLATKAAAAFLRMNAAYHATTGRHFDVNSAFRTMSEQQYEYDTQGPAIAAVPGRSTHQQGRSVDISTKGLGYASPEYTWLSLNARNYGFRNDAVNEAWHWTHYD